MEWIEANLLELILGVLGTILALILGGIWAAWRYSIRVARWTGKVDTDRTTFRASIAEIREDVKLLLRSLRSEMSPGSPLRLTDLGREMSEMIGGKEWGMTIAASVDYQAEGKEPYEIQEFSSNYVHNKMPLTDEERAKIQACAYQHGVTEAQVKNVLAIELRDALLASQT